MKKISLSLALLLTTSVALAGGPGAGGTGGGTGGSTGGGAPVCGCVELVVSKEQAVPGSLAQMKIALTEPKPISTGGGSIEFAAFDALVGISLASHTQDAYGVAVVSGGKMYISVQSPSSTFGSTIDYPILNVVGHVPPTAIAGDKIPFSITPSSLQFFDPNGNPYPTATKDGFLNVVSSGVVLSDVQPGSAVVPAGGIVRIFGSNFFPNTQLRFAEANIQHQFYVSSNEIDVLLATPANMHGMQIIAKNPDNTQDVYFSYQRTYPTLPLSTDPVLSISMPLAPPALVTSATVTFTNPNAVNGVALSNISTADAFAALTLLDASGNVVAFSSMSAAASHYTVRSLAELFPGFTGTTVRVNSSVPVEVLGIVANELAGTATPVVAH